MGVAASPDALQERVRAEVPALVVLAFDDMQGDTFALCRRIRALGDVPIVVATDLRNGSAVASAFAAGASDVTSLASSWQLLGYRAGALVRAGHAQAELRASREALEQLQRIASVGSWSLDSDTHEMRWSSGVFDLLGLAPGEVKTDFESFALCIHPDDREPTRDLIEGAIREQRRFDAALRVVLTSGAVRHIQLRGEPSTDGHSLRGTLQDITEQRRAQDKIRTLAQYDSLTGLVNRRRFMERLQKVLSTARRERHRTALLYMDLDQFKRINDTLGHTTGDELLQGVAELLFDRVRSTDLVGRPWSDRSSEVSRLGGDEFAVLLTELDSRDDAGLVATRILDALPTPIRVAGHEISTTASIGIAVFPDDGDDVETLVKHADRAMYHAKESGRNNFQFFEESMNAGAMRRLTLESHLRNALEADQMRLVYQPLIDATSGETLGVEALARWTDPELGAVSPREFIPLAEETGLIVALGDWVLREACAQTEAWREAGHGPLRMSVNVSTRQFGDRDLIARVANALRETKLDPSLLELEITESVLLQDDEGTARVLRDLRAMGLRVALDDFGTGYSSLSYLARFPLDTLKLDRALVRDLPTSPSARGIATAVISMAHALDLRVVAEGVDDQEQAVFLREHGCDEIQGFLVCPPVEPDELVAFLGTSR